MNAGVPAGAAEPCGCQALDIQRRLCASYRDPRCHSTRDGRPPTKTDTILSPAGTLPARTPSDALSIVLPPRTAAAVNLLS